MQTELTHEELARVEAIIADFPLCNCADCNAKVEAAAVAFVLSQRPHAPPVVYAPVSLQAEIARTEAWNAGGKS